MWMLYGGMWNDGVMVDFSHSAMTRIIKVPEIMLGFWKNDQFKVVQILHQDHFNVELSDVLYCSEPIEVVKRSDMRCKLQDEAFVETLGWHRKAYPWCYENECRLIISIPKEEISEQYFSVPKQKWALKVDVGNIFDEMKENGRIFRAPNSKLTKYEKSKLAARIDWNLCGKECPGKKEK